VPGTTPAASQTISNKKSDEVDFILQEEYSLAMVPLLGAVTDKVLATGFCIFVA
jgi:hypothetical protein